MPHFSADILETDLDGLCRLHQVLHGRPAAGASATRPMPSLPTLEDRFGLRPAPKPRRAHRRHAALAIQG